jgi:hypothetical protein
MASLPRWPFRDDRAVHVSAGSGTDDERPLAAHHNDLRVDWGDAPAHRDPHDRTNRIPARELDGRKLLSAASDQECLALIVVPDL